ncbi:MAG: hypothetical protein AB1656_05085 [Candidatus Omnitrophota bacterium]
MAFVYTLGHWEQNSFVGLTEADAFFADHIDAALWAGYTNEVKQRALILASRILNTVFLFANGNPYFSSGPYAQALALPLDDHDAVSGTATGGTAGTLICSSLANPEAYRNDIFNYGSIRITEGANIYEHKPITDFDASTGTLTVGEDFSSAIDATSGFLILYPLPRYKREAVCEFALIVARTGGKFDAALNANALEPGGSTPSNVLPGRVLTILENHRKGTRKVVR